jgi:class 3 adenylate cyclase
MNETRSETSLLIAFTNLSRFTAQSLRQNDIETANMVDAYYEHLASAVEAAGGKVVKFIGDGALIVFPEDAVDRGVEMLLNAKTSIDSLMSDRGWDCRFGARVHFGTVVAGPFGARSAKKFDVIGKAVNATALLDYPSGITLSVEAFRQLNPALRTHFKKHTLPITYIRTEDPRPIRRK